MKRVGNLYPQITDFANLLYASRQAQQGKRFRPNILEFNYNLERELLTLQRELISRTYQPGAYRTFHLIDIKSRLISAAPYRDRVVHHALCNIIVPIFESTFIHDSYANRIGFGTHRALKRFTKFARTHEYVLQCDIQKYFPSIDREILKNLVRRKIKCPDTLWLIETIIDNGNDQESVIEYFPGDDLLTPLQRPKGLPIGNLTSQFLANVMLNPFDHFVKERLNVDRYLRYVDDFALFSDDRDFLAYARLEIEDFLTQMRLKIHPIKSQLSTTKIGASFLGFRILPDRIRVKNTNLHRARGRLNRLRSNYINGKIKWSQVERSLNSWNAHLKHGDTWRLRQQIFSVLTF